MKPLALPLAVLLLAAPAALAQDARPASPQGEARVPSFFTLPYQGRLTDPAGAPVTATGLSFGFLLWDAPTGGFIKWTESHTLDVSDGLFSIQLGSEFPFSGSGPTVDFGQPLWLEVIVEGQSLGRTSLGGVPLAGAAGTVADGGVSPAALGLFGGSTDDGLAVVYDAPSDGFRLAPMPSGGGFSLPYSGSGTESSALFGLSNAGGGATFEAASSGDGLVVTSAGAPNQTNASGLHNGVEVQGAGGNGVFVGHANRSGLAVEFAGFHGVDVQAAGIGLRVQSSTIDGLQINSVGSPSTTVISSASNGVEVQGAEGNGVFVGHADGNGLHVEGAAGHAAFLQGEGPEATANAAQTTLYVRNPRTGGIGTGTAAWLETEATHSASAVLVLHNEHGARLLQGLGSDGSGGYTTVFTVQNDGSATFAGNLNVTGTKNFRIDHPLDPENRYLNHYAVESDEVLNTYSGTVPLDANGEATVVLAEYVEPITRDFRYQLTPIGAPMPALYVAEEVADGRFRIAGGAPGQRVSWAVTGVRDDPAVRLLRRPVEEVKEATARGRYLVPAAFGYGPERGIGGGEGGQ